MRLVLISLIGAAGLASAALAQPAEPQTPASDSTPVPAPAQPAPAPTPPTSTPMAPAAAQPVPAPMAPGTPAPPAPEAAAPEAPPPPPAPPTDPAAIAALNTLEQVCIPSANGGNLAQIAKAQGFRKSGDNFVMKQREFQLIVLSSAGNPTQCHVDIIHAVDLQAPARPIVLALHDWAAVERDWSVYRNDKSVISGSEFTTRSWEHAGDGKSEGLVLTTIRKADGSPMKGNADTSEMIYSVTKTAPGT
ncbi:MAG TPA: hypothetical protein VII73_03935 [Caulobacteraceae bacterium]